MHDSEAISLATAAAIVSGICFFIVGYVRPHGR